MSEGLSYDKFPHLKIIREKRESLGLEKLNVSLLTTQTGSQDLSLAQKAKTTLETKWNLEPEKDAKNASTIDLMKQVDNFSEEERKIMFSQLVGIQLTEGCNGNCYFCYFGKKKGVEAKYSFESVKDFLKKYGSLFPQSIALYWNSDPFDYRDGSHNFTDVYKSWREIRPKELQYVSTAMPRGGEEDFIDFMKYVANEQRGKRFSGMFVTMRISLAKHNTQRVEASFEKLTKVLLEDGYSQKEINDFYDACVKIEGRFSAHRLGPLISEHDDIGQIFTPACRDGVVITPQACQAIMVTAPTVYEPSGQKSIEILSDQADKKTPVYRRTADYSEFNITNSLALRTKFRQTMIDNIKTHAEKDYELENPTEDLVLKLGREAASIGRLLIDLAELPSLTITELQGFKQEKKKYLQVTASVFGERRINTQKYIEQAEALTSQEKLTPDEKEKVNFYILLTKTYLMEMDFLARQIEEKQSVETIGAIATVFRQVGRNQARELPKIIHGLTLARRDIESGSLKILTSNDATSSIQHVLLQTVGQPFGINNLEQKNWPEWFKKLIKSYAYPLKNPVRRFFGL